MYTGARQKKTGTMQKNFKLWTLTAEIEMSISCHNLEPHSDPNHNSKVRIISSDRSSLHSFKCLLFQWSQYNSDQGTTSLVSRQLMQVMQLNQTLGTCWSLTVTTHIPKCPCLYYKRPITTELANQSPALALKRASDPPIVGANNNFLAKVTFS